MSTYNGIHLVQCIKNSLRNWVVDVDNINTFKARLDRFWSNQEVLCDFKVDITGTGDRSQCDNVVVFSKVSNLDTDIETHVSASVIGRR